MWGGRNDVAKVTTGSILSIFHHDYHLSFSRQEHFTNLQNFIDHKKDFLLSSVSRNTPKEVAVYIPLNFHTKIW